MNLIGGEELKERLDRDDVKLVMVLGEWAYRSMHIPGSLHFDKLEGVLEALRPEDDIVLYDSGPRCVASLHAYNILKSRGYGRVWRYAGGLEDWERAGYPLEGELLR